MERTRRAKASRVWFWRWRRNPLRRRSDSVEAWIVLGIWTLALLGGFAAGQWALRSAEDSIASRSAEVHTVSAVLTEDAPKTPGVTTSGTGGDLVWAKVSWTSADGATHTGRARVEPGGKAGTTATVWTDGTGKLVSEPATATEAMLESAFAGVLAGTGVGAGVLLCGWLVRRHLERRRTGEWETEWKQVGPQWRKRMTG
ncbi:hypothetical protein [Streptomyces europaeiscabiei]|uniref:Rv1733c family protein n=1 Tax=Streptomyces europaeiscabiei TaxID=146819 RepID=UPI002E0EB2BE|nr:hypothetical protein OHB30_02010 [Streptomyces europaeiscabiei]